MFTLPHRRYNPLINEWVLVSPHRTARPWQGERESPRPAPLPVHDRNCFLCPGNSRAHGSCNPDYRGVFIFDNDFPALLKSAPSAAFEKDGLLLSHSERGACRVVCFSPRHDLTLARMDTGTIRDVLNAFTAEFNKLGELPWVRHVQIFENRGDVMGASSPHPHAQIWATETLPTEPAKELAACTEYTQQRGTCLLCDYLRLELKETQRIVCMNGSFVALVPFWAVWPFEVMVLPRRHICSLLLFTDQEFTDLADILKRVTSRFDNLFQAPFPYSMGFHQRPTDGAQYPELHFHVHFLPPLLRSANVRKFMVGYELLAEPQRDITPESAAERLRCAEETHYVFDSHS